MCVLQPHVSYSMVSDISHYDINSIILHVHVHVHVCMYGWHKPVKRVKPVLSSIAQSICQEPSHAKQDHL